MSKYPSLNSDLPGIYVQDPLTTDPVTTDEVLHEGDDILMQTQNTLYRIEKREDGTYISGHPEYCPVPTKCDIAGSTLWGSGMLKLRYIGVGMCFEFSTEVHPTLIITTVIKSVKVEENGRPQS